MVALSSHSGGMESEQGPLSTSEISGLLYLPRVIVRMEKLVEWRLAGETEVLGENLPQRHFVHHKSHLSYGAVNGCLNPIHVLHYVGLHARILYVIFFNFMNVCLIVESCWLQEKAVSLNIYANQILAYCHMWELYCRLNTTKSILIS
jgi:hypothetical protein